MLTKLFASLYNAKRVIKVDWDTYIVEQMQLGEMRDKQRSPSMAKFGPYLVVSFGYVLRMPTHLAESLVEISRGVKQMASGVAKKRKLKVDIFEANKEKVAVQMSLQKSLKAGSSQKTKEGFKLNFFPQYPQSTTI